MLKNKACYKSYMTFLSRAFSLNILLALFAKLFRSVIDERLI